MPDIARDPCTCLGVRLEKRYIHEPYKLCAACRAWDEGYVLVRGRRRYLKSAWLRLYRPDE